MKQHFLLSLMLGAMAAVMAQPSINNHSFENWTDSVGKKYPTHWDCDTFLVKNDIVKRVSPGSQGTYSVHIGSYVYNGELWGAQIEYNDTLTSNPGSLQFDYKEFNNDNAFANGLIVKVVFYDSVGDYIDDYTWYSNGNQSSYKTVTMPLPYANEPRPAYVLINLYYFNFGGAIDEYCIVDNLRFLNWVNNIEAKTTNKFKVYPNPSNQIMNIDCKENQTIGKAELLSVDGRTIELELTERQINVSGIQSGFYTLILYDENGQIFGRNSVKIIH